MALIKCTECGKEISDSAVSCPHCGCKTSRGQTEAQAKAVLFNYAFAIGFLLLGVILFCSGSAFINDYTSNFWGRYIWESGDWIEDSEAVMAVIKEVIGIGLIVGGVVDIFVLAKKAKELPTQPADTISTSENYTSSSPSNAPKFNSEHIPTWKRIQMEEEQAQNKDQTN